MVKANNKPLVTVAVVAYNSSRFVLETLESIKAQTYQNIELIVSDDCSQDNTVELCRDWVDNNKFRFVNSTIITTPVNTGTAGNANRALAVAKGEWIKYIAGDDLLHKNAIDIYMSYANTNNKVFFADRIQFFGAFKDSLFKLDETPLKFYLFKKNVTAKTQYSVLTRQMIGYGSTFFVNRSILNEVNGFDERFPLMDDHPLLIKISSAGYIISAIPEVTIYYRCHSTSVTHSKQESVILSNLLVLCTKEYKYKYKYERLNSLWRLFLSYSLFLMNAIIKKGNNKRNVLCLLLYYLYIITDPFLWFSRWCNLKNSYYKLFLFTTKQI